MDIDVVVNIIQQAALMILLLSAPMLLIGLAVGLIVSVFQATTQIQEATLSFVPKIVAVLLSLVIFGPWIISTIVNFTKNLFLGINGFIS
ncbi:flagellar biosynthetic protein FliQ [Peptoanaerobacter stomatis]|uniref:Flagellar biosynthetic protein FliQ n=1 Tax=Peptoanaerobacter stomatis TaxID=796937 RepID=J6HFQ7_9FIRM|nr:flagellar biosynthesis protein FliQ [Peptoanaerobacter stomatis]EHL17274.1 flagellar biosynthetic protein FliQ [Peptoanaerobacter stomatis]EJU21563.1 flagellar biosynthetic protein FliQ [Peptoanaerobacter stomatis]NWO24753.1 flagellar biosynthesis protein FliQ [Peptostreptococcaceae bacterium oral taxon 081]